MRSTLSAFCKPPRRPRFAGEIWSGFLAAVAFAVFVFCSAGVSADPLIGAPTAATADSSFDDEDSSAAYGGGQYLLAWTSVGGGTSGGDVYARFVSADASSMGAIFAVATGSGPVKTPRVAWVPAGGGTFAIAHRDHDNLILRRFNSSGTLLGSSTVNNAATTNRFSAFDLASDGTGNFCIVWTGWLDGTSVQETWAEIRDAAGTLVKDDTKVAAASASDLDHHRPSATWNATLSEWAFTWEEFNASLGTAASVEAVAWDATLSAATTAEIAVSAATGNDADVAWNSQTNEYLIVWTKLVAGLAADVYARRFAAADGSPVGAEFALETDIALTQDATVAYSPAANEYIVAVERKLGPARGTYAQVLKADGTALGSFFALSDDALERETEPSLARNPVDGQFLATWTERLGTTQHLWKVRLDIDPPSAPTGLTATADSNSIALSWNLGVEGDLDLYRVLRSETTGGPYSVIASVDAPATGPVTFDDTTAAPNVAYYYVVRAVDLRGNESAISSEATATIDTIAPASPTGLTATADADSISLSWNLGGESDLAEYRVFRSTTSGSGYGLIATVPAPGTGPVTHDDATAATGVPYFYIVRAVDDAGNESANSNEATATISGAAPPAPTLDASNVRKTNDTTPRITGGGTTEGYIIKLYEGAVEIGSGVAGPGGVFDFHTTTVLGEGNHLIQAKAQNGAGGIQSGYSDGRVVTIDTTPPGPVTNLIVVAGSGWTDLQWQGGGEPDLLGFDIYRRDNGVGAWVKKNGNPIRDQRYVDRTVVNGTSYEYRVLAVDDTKDEN